MPTVNVHAAKTDLSRLVDLAAAGEDVIIANAGRPMVRLVPVTHRRPPAERIRDTERHGPDRRRLRRAAPRTDSAGLRSRAVNLLLDTQALLWWKQGSRKLGARARRAIERDAATVRVSAASAWEIALKSHAGRLRLAESLHAWSAGRASARGLSRDERHDRACGGGRFLAGSPRRSLRRLLIAQARHDGLRMSPRMSPSMTTM